MELKGIHHLTAISAQIRENKRFYTEVLGMRLVKRSVNQDDVSAYHLFYADAKGSPGTDITFFDWPVQPERRGGPAIVRTHFRVNGAESIRYWQDRLRTLDVQTGETTERDGRATFDFEDFEGQRLAFVDAGSDAASYPWDRSPVPANNQIQGLGPIQLSVPMLEPTHRILQEVLFMRPVREFPNPGNPGQLIHVYEMGSGGAGAELQVTVQPNLPRAQQGAGGVHHVAFRTPDSDYDAWAERLNQVGVANSGRVDRYWFKSLYFREPNGILFEIATDGPGFGVDEDQATLGEKVVLPPFLEPNRAEIVSNLTPLD